MRYLILFLLLTGFLFFSCSVDSTDESMWSRSGMRWYKDHGTGCEYLAGGGGFLIPRVDRDGKHMCGSERYSR